MADKAQLHELLAALGDLDARSSKAQKEGIETFSKRVNHFLGSHKVLRSFREEDKNLEESAEQHQALTTTVGAKLRYIEKPVAAWLDAFLQKEATNQTAKADLVVDGKVLATGLPAPFYLGLEKELKQIRSLFESIPTLQPGIQWVEDKTTTAADNSKGVWRVAHPVRKLKTKQTVAHKILVPATDHHPAQIEKWTEQEPVGEFIEEVFSGMVTPAEKSRLLNNVTKLITAAKRARMRANKAEVVKLAIGKALFEYMHSAEDTD